MTDVLVRVQKRPATPTAFGHLPRTTELNAPPCRRTPVAPAPLRLTHTTPAAAARISRPRHGRRVEPPPLRLTHTTPAAAARIAPPRRGRLVEPAPLRVTHTTRPWSSVTEEPIAPPQRRRRTEPAALRTERRPSTPAAHTAPPQAALPPRQQHATAVAAPRHDDQPQIESLATLLRRDASPLALRPKDPEDFDNLLHRLYELRRKGYADSTIQGDDRRWDEWAHWCRANGTSPRRTDAAANDGIDRAGYDRETVLACGFVIHKLATMKPRQKDAPCAHPESAQRAWEAVRRAHFIRTRVELCKTKDITLIIRGMMREFLEEYGPEALLPQRKEPLRRQTIAAILALPDGTPILGTPLNWNEPFWVIFRAWVCTMAQTGFRKNETSTPDDGRWHHGRLSRSFVTWRLSGRDVATPTPDELRDMKAGDFACLKPPAAKNDPFCQLFGAKPIFLPYEPDLCFSAAVALRDLELALPIPAHQRRDAPLFSSDGRFEPLRHRTVDKTLHALLCAIMPAEHAARYSAHSFRIGLACALLALNTSAPLIQALLRWKGEQSLAAYARLNPEDYGRHISRAATANVTSITTANLPRIDNDDLAARFQYLVPGTSPAARTRATGTRPGA